MKTFSSGLIVGIGVAAASLAATVAGAVGEPGGNVSKASASAGLLKAGTTVAAPATVDRMALINDYCSSCHNDLDLKGGLSMDDLQVSDLSNGAHNDIWEKMLHKLRLGEMPPQGEDRPADADVARFTTWLQANLDAHGARAPHAGPTAIRRLTKTEYRNAVRDLLGVNVGGDLPPDTIANAFDNTSEVLSISPLQLEKYMAAARRGARLALGDSTIPKTIDAYQPTFDQAQWGEGAPIGTRRAIGFDHYFQVSGEYELRIFLGGQRIGYADLPLTEGVRFFRMRATMPAGMHSVAVVSPKENSIPEGAFQALRGPGGSAAAGPIDVLYTNGKLPELDVLLDKKRIESFKVQPPTVIDLKTPAAIVPGEPYIQRVELEGPFSIAGAGNTASRRKVFVCMPSEAAAEEACANKILTTFVRRAYRRDVTAAEVAPYMATYRKSRAQKDFEFGIQQALQAVLVSPGFLFRVESTPGPKRGLQRVNDYDLASRLSFFLWSTIPDDRLLDLAREQRLRQPAVLNAEVARMLADPKAAALAENFGMQYLGLQSLDGTTPDPVAYPKFSDTLRNEFAEESRLFMKSVFLGNRSVLDIVNADYTYLNEDLARHYGVKGVVGDQFRRVTFKPGDARGGVLSQGSVSMVTSHTNVTSPVLRGKWVLTNLLASPPSNPPPGVPPIQEADKSGRRLTGREQMEMHRTAPMCASCHMRMDPFGFSMEQLDVLGAWRDRDEAGPVNALVTMPDGKSFTGVAGLKARLTSKPDDFAEAFTTRMFTYALGRKVQGLDMPEVRKVVRQTSPGGHRFNDIVLAVIQSPQFQQRKVE